MLMQPRSEQDEFLDQLKQRYGMVSLSDALGRMRAQAWDRFLHLGLPTRQTEVYQYVKLRQLYAQRYQHSETVLTRDVVAPYVCPRRKPVIVSVNGRFSPELSDLSALGSKVVVSELSAAMNTYGAFLSNQWTAALKDETDAFAVANAALHSGGVLIYVAPRTQVSAPIQLLRIVHGQGVLSLPRLHVFLGSEAEASLVSTTVEIEASGYALNGVCEVTLEDNARLHFSQATQGLSANAWLLDALRARLKRHSVLNTVAYTDGAMTMRNDYRIILAGEGAEAALNGLWMLDEKA